MTDLIDLSRRAVAANPQCRHLHGMRTLPDKHGRIARITGHHTHSPSDPGWVQEAVPRLRSRMDPTGFAPDLSDPATVGGLEALVIDAHGGSVVLQRGNGWFCVETDANRWDDDNVGCYQEALVCALEAAGVGDD